MATLLCSPVVNLCAVALQICSSNTSRKFTACSHGKHIAHTHISTSTMTIVCCSCESSTISASPLALHPPPPLPPNRHSISLCIHRHCHCQLHETSEAAVMTHDIFFVCLLCVDRDLHGGLATNFSCIDAKGNPYDSRASFAKLLVAAYPTLPCSSYELMLPFTAWASTDRSLVITDPHDTSLNTTSPHLQYACELTSPWLHQDTDSQSG